MDFFLSSNQMGKKIHFPMNPERVTASTGTNIISFEVIELGQIEFPRGKVPARISWTGKLPGERRRGSPFINKDWKPPQELVDMLQTFRDKNVRLQLLISDTPINTEVYLKTFEHTWSGGFGDCDYSLELVQARDLKIYTDAEWQKVKNQSTGGAAQSVTRSAPVKVTTYTVKSGDYLSTIAKKFLGSAARWTEIYNDPGNRKKIGPDPNVIKVGLVLTIPAGGKK